MSTPEKCILLEFMPKEGMESDFIERWQLLTDWIYHNLGSMGSRLHRSADGKFVAYAQWPSAEVYEAAIIVDEEGERLREQMLDSLVGIQSREILSVVSDRLRAAPYPN